MVDTALIIAKAGLAKKHIERAAAKKGETFETFSKDPDRQDIVAFNLHQAIQNCIDAAAHIISEQGLGVPGNVNEIFYLLEENGYISTTITEKMVKAVGFRNLLVHEYSKIDLKNVYKIAVYYVEDLLGYFAAIFSKLDIKS